MHAIEINDLVLIPEEGLLLGNGDFSVSIYQAADRIIWRFGKVDVWDRRHATEIDPEPMHIEELAKGVRDEGWEFSAELGRAKATKGTDNDQRVAELTQYGPPSYRTRTFPCPKPVGELALHLPADQHGLTISQRLVIEQGTVDIECAWESGVTLKVHCFVAPSPNVLAVRWRIEGADRDTASWAERPVWFSLYRWPDPEAKDFVAALRNTTTNDMFDKYAINDNPPMDPPVARQLDGRWIVEQAFAPDLQFPDGFRYALMPVVPGGSVREGPTYGSGEARVRVLPAQGADSGWLAVAIGTSNDPGGHEAQLLTTAAQITGDDVLEQWGLDNLAASTEFWSRSSVSLGDKFFEQLWYENLHARRCTFRGDVVAPGLFLPSTLNDFSLWHGDYHTNYNYQQPFWGAYEANQISLGDSYFPGFEHMIELGRKLADYYYGCRGTFIQLTGYPFPIAKDPYGVGPFSRMTYMTGWAVNQYWFRWLHTQDEEWLAETGYPPIRDAAVFYLDFLSKGADGLYHGFPSDQGENQFTPDVSKYTDRPQVMRHVRYCLQIAIEAAEVLGVDANLVTQWRDVLANFPVIDDLDAAGFTDEQKRQYALNPPEFLGWEDTALTLSDQQHPGLAHKRENPLWSWYFGHFPIRWMVLLRRGLFDAERDFEAARDIVARWRLPNGLLRAMSRDIYGFAGGWSESLGVLAPVQEMLLQSWDGAIRLFADWPRNIDASFTTFRAEGAFLVSASLNSGEVDCVTIGSERGRPCCVASPWDSGCRVIDEAGNDVPVTVEPKDEGGDWVRFETQAGVTYELTPA
ncbi:MAG: glycosyl hydrolase family 95 catalytic domain-containing protein [Planctomycetota bacterium]|jgi:hypothetical protein